MNDKSWWNLGRLFMVCLFVVVMGVVMDAYAQIQIFPPQPFDVDYVLTDLGPNTYYSVAYAINNEGRAAGFMIESCPNFPCYSYSRAFRTSANQPIDPIRDNLGVLSGTNFSEARAIDNNGVTVGGSGGPAYGDQRGFRYGYSGAGMEDLNIAGISSRARGINDHGWIVGHFGESNGSEALLSFGPYWNYSLNSMLGSKSSAAHDVNNRDEIVGWKKNSTASLSERAFLLGVAGGVWRHIDIGTLPSGSFSWANGINDSGEVVGASHLFRPGSQRPEWVHHAFLWLDSNYNGISDPGEMRDLDTMNNEYSEAKAINNYGTAVGSYMMGQRACAFYPNGQMWDLNTLVLGGTGGWTLREAHGINDNGQIVGSMVNQAGQTHAFRLDPRPRVWLRLPLP